MLTHTAPPIDTTQQYPTCGSCERLMRPFGALRVDHPNTVTRGTSTTCASCRQAQREGRPGAQKKHLQTGTPCLGCQQPLRPKGTKLVAHPGTRPHQGGGYCDKCFKDTAAGVARQTLNSRAAATRAAARMTDPPKNLEGPALKNRAALDAYFAGRRNRKVPPEGITLEAWRKQAMVTA